MLMDLWYRHLIQFNMIYNLKMQFFGQKLHQILKLTPSTSFYSHSFLEDKGKVSKQHKCSRLYNQMVLFIKILSIQSALSYKSELMFSLMSLVMHILKLHFKKSNKQVLMLDFGKLEMEWKITFFLCDIFSIFIHFY